MKTKITSTHPALVAGVSAEHSPAFVSRLIDRVSVRANLPAVATNRAFIRAWVARRAKTAPRRAS